MFHKNLYHYSLFTAAATLILLGAGGLVTSTGSGLSVPDWPLSYGKFFPPMIGGIRFEHSHRLIAAFVGFCTFGLSIWLWRVDRRPLMRVLSISASVAILAQALLGGLTVKFMLPTPVSVSHACLGQTFFCLLCVIVLLLSREWKEATVTPSAAAPVFFRLCCTAATFAYAQLVAGAVVRHTGGKGIEVHLFLAFFIVVHLLFLNVRLFLDRPLTERLGAQMILLNGLVLFQLFLGLGTYLVKYLIEKAAQPRPVEVLLATAHQTVGALILASLILLVLRARRLFSPSGKTSSPSEFLELMKPRLTLTALLATLAGYLLASGEASDLARLFHTMLGAFLLGSGGNALNQYFERDADARMPRTQNRPLPGGRLDPILALWFGWIISLTGLLELLLFVSPLTAGLGLVIFLSYVFIYTPLKRRTTLNTFVGAVPGALPFLLGWVAGEGPLLSANAAALFLILYLWQLPHFYAIAWVYRDDYRLGGFQMLPQRDPSGKETASQIVLFSVLLFAAALMPFHTGLSGVFYLVVAAASSAVFLVLAIRLLRDLSKAKQFVTASIVYLCTLMMSLLVDKT